MSHTVPYRQRLAQRCAGYPTAGIIGATVMPHVVYLHSALTKSRVVCRDDGVSSGCVLRTSKGVHRIRDS